MHIEVIETLASFNRLEENWNAVYDQDPDAQLFLSFRWLSVWLGQIPSPWIILAAKESDSAESPTLPFSLCAFGSRLRRRASTMS